MKQEPQPSVAVVIIGDEILKGTVVEANARFFIDRFRELGANLGEIAFITDDIEAISEKVSIFADRYDFVCTTGGIGPTHDDVTIQGVAQAFGVGVSVQPHLLEQIRKLVGADFSDGHRRLASLPEGAELIHGEGLKWPVLKVRNVYVFPGIPRLLQQKFNAIASVFEGSHYFCGSITLSLRETEFCEALDAIVAQHGSVSIGSYPRLENGIWVSRLTIDGFDPEHVQAAYEALIHAFSSHVRETEAIQRSNESRS